MDNQYFVDAGHLSGEALIKKHRLERDPSSRTSHMEYQPGMEQIASDVRRRVTEQINGYDASVYTVREVKSALEHEIC